MQPGISSRQQVALNLCDTCCCASLADETSALSKEVDAQGKDYWSITFRNGYIRVYSPGFILLHCAAPKARNVARSEYDAKQFLMGFMR